MKKRILSFWLAVCMVMSLVIALPVTASADSSGKCGDNVYWTLDSSGTLTISGSGIMYDYANSPAPWYNSRSSVKKAVIKSGVTTIGNYAFSYCSSLTSVTIPDSVITIGNYAFYRCGILTSVTIPNSVTTIGDYAFCACYSLTSVTIPDSVTSIDSGAFSCCSSLTSVTIPDSVTSINCCAFFNCDNLESIIIPDSVIRIEENAFYGCASLTSITISDCLTYIGGYAFAETPYYMNEANWYNEGLYIGNYLVGVKQTLTGNYEIKDGTKCIASQAFWNCSGMTSVIIPDSLCSIEYATFLGCNGLTSVVIPDNVTTLGERSFEGCYNLTTITIPDSITQISGWAFDDCRSIKDVYYTGTQEQWNEIVINNNGNGYLTSATIHYNGIESESSVSFYSEEEDKKNDKEQNTDNKQNTEDKKEENNQIILKIGQKKASVFGKTQTNDVAPIVRNDRTMLPARFVAESLGAEVYWDGVKHEVKIVSSDGKITILLYIGSNTAYVNGKAVTLDSPAFVENDRTYTPIRFIVENLGASVDWDGENLQVIITK